MCLGQHQAEQCSGCSFAGCPDQQAVIFLLRAEQCLLAKVTFRVPSHNTCLHQGSVVEREPPPDRPASWTGTGFAHMLEGGWVEFHVNDVPFSTEYDVVIRYEPQVSARW